VLQSLLTLTLTLILDLDVDLDVDLDFQSLANYGHDNTHAASEGQRSAGAKARLETNVRSKSDTTDRITFPTNEVDNKHRDAVGNFTETNTTSSHHG